jgi:hypothetical protein
MTGTTNSRATAGETPTARQRRVWDKLAPSYDKQIASLERVQFGGGREGTGARVSGNVLEVAIGTGRNSFDTVVCAGRGDQASILSGVTHGFR